MRHTTSSLASMDRCQLIPALWAVLLALLLAPSAPAQVVINEIMANNATALTDEDGAFSDWFEIYNTGVGPVNLAGWTAGSTNLSQNPTIGQWVFPAANLPAGGHLVIFASGKNRAVPGSPLHTNFKLSKNGAKLVLAQGGIQQDMVVFGLQLLDKSIGRAPSGSANWTLTASTPGSGNVALSLDSPFTLKFNEWLATNSAGANQDWLELYNPSTHAVDLGNLIFSGRLTTPTADGAMPLLSFIEGLGFFKFTCDKPSPYLSSGANHLDFRLSSSTGETLSLFAADRTTVIERISFLGGQVRDQSEGRLPDGSTNIFRPLPSPTPAASNFQDLTGVLINEALTHTDPPLEDAIELYNPNPFATNIGNWWLSNAKDDPQKYRFPNPTTIPAYGFVVVYEMAGPPNGTGPGFNQSGSGTTPYFTLNSAHGDEVFLSTGDNFGFLTGFRRSVVFASSENGVSFGRHVTSDTNTEFVAMSSLSFGTSVTRVDPPSHIALFRTGLGATNPYPIVGPIVISEIMYHPPDILAGTNHLDDSLNEYIELHNITTLPAPLYDTNFYDGLFDYRTNTWRLENAVTFTFPTNVVVPAGGSILIVNFNPATNLTQLAAFRAKYGVPTNTPMFGPYGGKLSNASATIELYHPDKTQGPQHPDYRFIPFILVERVKYSDGAPWPLSPDGAGASLQRVTNELYANDPANWTGGTPTPGWQSVRIDSAMRGVNSMILQFTARAGSTYRAQYCDSLPGGSWIAFDTVLPQGVTARVMATNSLSGAGSTRFYRIVSP